MIEIICKKCGKKKRVYPSDIIVGKGKFCSIQCYNENKKEKKYKENLKKSAIVYGFNKFWIGRKFSEEHRKKISEAHMGSKNPIFGKHLTEETKEKIRYSNNGEKNMGWKGESITYGTLHDWVRRWLGKPTKCEFCSKDGLTGREIHWANKSGEYKRDLSDWLRLCRKCHVQYDNERSREFQLNYGSI